MKIPKRLKQVAEQIAKTAEKQKRLNRELSEMLDNLGVDTSGLSGDGFFSAIGYLEGDCDPQPLFDYLEELK